jgi:hypothetical protein
MAVIITGNNTPTAGGITYGDGTTYANTAAGTSGQVLVSAGALAPTWGTPSTSTTATNLAGGSNGTIPYQSAAGTTQMLAVGTSGQVLQSNAAAAPTWVTPSSGAMVLVATYSVTGAATVDIENAFSTYDHYIIKGSNITCGANQLFLQTKVGGSYTSQSYVSFDAKGDGGTTAWTIYNITATAESRIALSGDNFNFTLYACNLNNQNGTAVKPITGQIVGNSGTHVFYARGDSTAAVAGIRIYPSSGTFGAGKFYLYGLAKS